MDGVRAALHLMRSRLTISELGSWSCVEAAAKVVVCMKMGALSGHCGLRTTIAQVKALRFVARNLARARRLKAAVPLTPS